MAFQTEAAKQQQAERNAAGIVKVGISDYRHMSKPTRADIEKKSIQNDEGTLYDLAHDVTISNEGGARSWVPGVLVGGVKAENWQEQQVFAADVDGNLSVEDALRICERFNILPAFIYTTFSSVQNNKYRIVWCLPEKTADIRIRQAVTLALYKLFPQADPSCKNADRIFYGGRALIYENYEARLDIYNLLNAVVDVITEQDKVNAARNIKSFCQDAGLNMMNGLPAIQSKIEDLTTNLYNIYRIVTKSSKNDDLDKDFLTSFGDYTINFALPRKQAGGGNYRYNTVNNERVELNELRNVDWVALSERCPVFRDFMNGVDKHHDVTYMVASNLVYIRGGEAKFMEGLRNRREYNEQKWASTFNYLRKRLYIPTSYKHIADYYPNAQQEARAGNILNAAKPVKGTINVYRTETKKTLAQAEHELRAAYAYALQQENAVSVLKFPTGIGKTELYLGIENAIIAVPTHKLKKELAERLQEAGMNVIASPELPEGLDTAIVDAIDKLYAKGAQRAANVYLRDIAKENAQIAEYIDALDAFYKVKDATVVTTHARLLFMQPTHHTHIIIDEDIMPTLLGQGSAAMSDIEATFGTVGRKGFGYKPTQEEIALRSAHTFIEEALPQVVCKMPEIARLDGALKDFEKKVIKSDVKSNVLGLLTCTHFVKIEETVHYIQKHELPNKNIIIFSATASELMYRKLFGDKLHFVESGTIETIGQIVQYVQYTLSRFDMSKNPTHIDWVKSIVGDMPVITHKQSRALFENVIETFGGLAGIDKYKGQDIAVVGTPHINDIAYRLIATALHIRVGNDEDIAYVPVERNGMEFKFMTYVRNPDLQTLQLDLIEAELVQAVGRARVLRYDCEVLLFSNYPVPGAEYK